MDTLRTGTTQIISHAGANQYQFGSPSACGIAALNCARVMFERNASGLRGGELLRNLLQRETTEEILSICSQWTTTAHAEVETILTSAPLFKNSLALASTTYSRPSIRSFHDLLVQLTGRDSVGAVVITRPPEIVVTMRIPVDHDDIFVTFDSHSRPTHPNGAGFIVSRGPRQAARYLDSIFPVDNALLSDPTLGWQAQYLANFSGQFLTYKRPSPLDMPAQLQELQADSTRTILDMQSRIEELSQQNRALVESNERLENEIAAAIQRYEQNRHPGGWGGPARQAAQWESISRANSSSNRASGSRPSGQRNDRSASNPFQQPPPGSSSASQSAATARSTSQSTTQFPTAPQPDRPPIGNPTQPNRPSIGSPTQELDLEDPGKRAQSLFGQLLDLIWRREPEPEAPATSRTRSPSLSSLSSSNSSFASLRPTFNCPVCMEDHPEEDIAVLGCGHSFCRDDLRAHVQSKLDERAWPMCPVCAAAGGDPEVVQETLIEQLGISEHHAMLLEELQLAPVSIRVECRGPDCGRTFWVDREDFDQETIMYCLYCYQRWCRDCGILLEFGQIHSCNGDLELEHLMRDRNWKFCPGCRTPIQKDAGCNHMTCRAPRCTVHFCYVCGDEITRSVARDEINAALQRHFSAGCNMFEVIPDVDAPP